MQVGIRSAAVSDWTRATKFLKQSLESHEVLYGKSDARTVIVVKLLQSVRRSRAGNGNAEDLNNLNGADGEEQPQYGTEGDTSPNDTSGFPLAEEADFDRQPQQLDFSAAEDLYHHSPRPEQNDPPTATYQEAAPGGSDQQQQPSFHPSVSLEAEPGIGDDYYAPDSPLTNSGPSSPAKGMARSDAANVYFVSSSN